MVSYIQGSLIKFLWPIFALSIASVSVGAQAIQGPPPTSAEPTVAQARDFVVSRVEAYGSGQCTETPGGKYENHATRKSAYLVQFSGGNIIVQNIVKKDEEPDKDGDSVNSKIVTTQAIPLSDIDIRLGDRLVIGKCEYSTSIIMTCKSSACVSYKSVTTFSGLDNGVQTQPRLDENQAVGGSGMIGLSDAPMAERIIKALQFYKDRSAATAPSPF